MMHTWFEVKEVNMDEIWRDVVGYEGVYQVSTLGKVRSVQRKIKYNGRGKGSGIHSFQSVELKQCLNTVGYYQVSLSVNNCRKRFMIHRLVAEAFCTRPLGKDYVNHINGNYLDNRHDNLEWVSFVENVRHAIVNGLSNIYGEDSHFSKFTNEQAEIIRRIKNKGISTKDLTVLLGVHRTCINKIYNGETYNENNKIKTYKL